MGTRGRRILGGAGVLLGLAAAGGFLAAYLASPTRDFATTSGLISGVLAALGFTVAVLALLPALTRPGGDPLETLAHAVAREWEREAVMRGLDRPEPLRVRWGPTERPVTETAIDASGDVTVIADVWSAHPARQLVILGEPGAGKTSAAVILVRRLLATRAEGDPVPVLLNVADWDPTDDHLDAWVAKELKARYRVRRTLAAALCDQGKVVPVLDGLDEMPASTSAVPALTNAVGMSRPLVVTCRSREYESLVSGEGAPLARAAVVEIRRVEAADAVAYLPAGQIEGGRRWRPVLDRLRDEPGGALASALRTPLMVFLAREGFRRPGTDPSDLLAPSHVDTIEAALLDGYVPAVYRDPGPARPGEIAPPTYAPDQVARWLGFLAAHIGVFHWWRLEADTRRSDNPLRATAWLVACVSVIAGTTAAGGFAERLFPEVFSGARTVVVMTLLGSVLLLPVCVIGRGTRVWGRPPSSLPRDVATGTVPVAAMWAALVLGVPSLGVSELTWHVLWIPVGLAVFVFSSAELCTYTAFHLAAWRLSRRGLAPFHLMPFLEDAHRRGVLRKVGPAYQFRHARLAEHLAAQHLGEKKGPAAEATGPSTKH